jgi:AbrB family looped-hinge helix DNA binding protein
VIRAKLTSKGQITIPVIVRNALNLQPGDELVFELGQDGEFKARGLKRRRLTELYASLPTETPYPGKAEIREEVAEKLALKMLGKWQET